MIRAYSKDALETAKRKLGEMFEIAVDFENIDIDEFASVFVSNADVVRSFETASPTIFEGKSSSEILSLLIERKHAEYELPEEATPEYWTGWVLACVQWYSALSFSRILSLFPASTLRDYYFPYHEEDISQIVRVVMERIRPQSPLREKRKALGLSQRELSSLSGVSERVLKAYEQGKLELSKAGGETLYSLSRVFCCPIEELLK